MESEKIEYDNMLSHTKYSIINKNSNMSELDIFRQKYQDEIKLKKLDNKIMDAIKLISKHNYKAYCLLKKADAANFCLSSHDYVVNDEKETNVTDEKGTNVTNKLNMHSQTLKNLHLHNVNKITYLPY